MTSTTLSRVAGALCAAGLLAAALPAAAVVANPVQPFSSLFVFGDSLSDAAGGNNLMPMPPNEGGLATPSPYDNGRVSNGPVAAEYLGGLLGLSQAQQLQYAVAGARSGASGRIPGVGTVNTGLQTQVGVFAHGGANAAYAGGLFMVWAGANDLRDYLETATPASDPSATFASILGNLGQAVTTLYGLGARNFLLPNIPNLGLTPASQALALSLNLPVDQFASGTTLAFNDAYAGAVEGWKLDPGLAGAHLYTFDTFSAHNQLFGAAVQQGWNTSNGCLVPVDGATQPQSACSVSFYVDDIHPTTAVHQVLAQSMAAAVPEPESMLLMASGLVALLGLARRRQRAGV